ncbi:MAG: phosphotransferase family protein [Pseudomonadota bacterium]
MTLHTVGETDFDPEDLLGYLRAHFQSSDPMNLSRISGGQSNPTYFVDFGHRRLVLRKQPNGPILKGAHAIDREYRVLEALHPTGVPVAHPVLYCDQPDVLGTPFYIMQRVDGRIFTDTTLAELAAEKRRDIWMAVADALAAMHRLDPNDVGLGDFGRPGNYFERQIGRWGKQYQQSPSDPIPDLDVVYDWLPKHLPVDDGAVGLCHGDFRLGNLMFHPTEPKVVAILDWELSTLGHPMADLGFCCMPWHTAPEEYGGLLGTDLDAMNLPDEAEFVARYTEQVGRAVDLLDFHKIFALFRFAVIFVGIADRAEAGTAADPQAAGYAHLAGRFAKRAADLIARQRQ